MRILSKQRGVTLVELMVGMVIGLFILGATASVYLANREAYRTADIASRLQENGRIALRVITEDLQMAGFMGNSVVAGRIDGRSGTPTTLPLAANDCANYWYLNLATRIEMSNDAIMYGGTCMQNRDYLATTDIVAVKRAAMGLISTAQLPDHADWTLLRTDLSRGAFFLGGTTPPASFVTDPDITVDRRWLAHVYFVAREEGESPALRRLRLGSGPQLRLDSFLVPGVQDLQVQFGIDADKDGVAESFVEPGSEGSAEIVAARVWILMQSETLEPDFDDSATYVYAGKSYTPGDGSPIETGANPEQYRRMLLSATVALRNGI